MFWIFFDDCDNIIKNGQNHIFLDEAIKIIITKYNKRNPDIIFLHEELNFIGEYSIESKTLFEIIKYLKLKNIRYENQYCISSIKRRIDLFLPEYNICIEADENDHINRDLIDDELKDNQLISNGYFIIRYDCDNFNKEKIINEIENDILLFSTEININDEKTLNKLILKHSLESLEGQYYQMFKESIIDEGFNIDFENVYKLCGYSQKGHAKEFLIKKLIKDVDYVFAFGNSKAKQGGHNKEIILLNKEAFKKFCILCGTEKGEEIRIFFIKTEENYKKILLSLLFNIKLNKDKLLNITKKKLLDIANENLNKKKLLKENKKKVLKENKKIIERKQNEANIINNNINNEAINNNANNELLNVLNIINKELNKNVIDENNYKTFTINTFELNDEKINIISNKLQKIKIPFKIINTSRCIIKIIKHFAEINNLIIESRQISINKSRYSNYFFN